MFFKICYRRIWWDWIGRLSVSKQFSFDLWYKYCNVRSCKVAWFIWNSAGSSIFLYAMRCAIWYHLHNLKNVKNTYGGVFSKTCNLLKVTLLHGCFLHLLNCTNGTICLLSFKYLIPLGAGSKFNFHKALGVLWTSYECSIYVMCPGGCYLELVQKV